MISKIKKLLIKRQLSVLEGDIEVIKKNRKIINKTFLELMDYIHLICVNEKIPYWLDSGTLLGAIRHNGFIPWDDDFDIGMLKSDYLIFLKVKNKYPLPKNIQWVIRDSETETVEHLSLKVLSNTNTEHFLLIDFLIFTNVNNKFGFKNPVTTLAFGLLFFMSVLNHRFKWTFLKLIERYILNFSDFMIKRNKKSNFMTYDPKTYAGGIFYSFKINWISSLELHQFEDREYYIPSKYKEYLTYLYGEDFMTPPNVASQRPAHIKKIIS